MDENLEKKPVLEENEGNPELTSAPDDTAQPEPAPAPAAPELNNDPKPEEEVLEQPKMFTQDEVNDLMGHVRAETRDRTLKYIYGRYGVEDESGMDDLVGNAQRYDTLKEESDAHAHEWAEKERNFTSEFEELKEKLALMESGIDKDRYEDAKFIIKGKGQPLTVESITAELATHPEWKQTEEKKVYTPEEPAAQIEIPEVPKVLGNENSNAKPQGPNEEDLAMEKYFKIK